MNTLSLGLSLLWLIGVQLDHTYGGLLHGLLLVAFLLVLGQPQPEPSTPAAPPARSVVPRPACAPTKRRLWPIVSLHTGPCRSAGTKAREVLWQAH